MKYLINTLEGKQLNIAVAKALGFEIIEKDGYFKVHTVDTIDDMEFWLSQDPLPYSTSWDLTGPLLHRHRISLNYSDPEEEDEEYCWAMVKVDHQDLEFDHADPLVAGLRAFVAKFAQDMFIELP